MAVIQKIGEIDWSVIKAFSSISANTIGSISGIDAPASAPPIVTTNLEIHYDFTNPACYNGSGSVAQDLTTNNRDLVFSSLPTWQGTYFDFDGVNDLGSIQNITSVNTSGTVGYWIKLNSNLVTTLTQRISGINPTWEFGRLDAGGGVTNGGLNNCSPSPVPNGSIGADLGTYNNTYTVGYTFNAGIWANLVYTWTIGGNAKTYVNGVLLNTCFPGNNSRVGTWTVGRSPGNTSRYYGGSLGWFTYYDTQLTDAQVLQNFNATKADYGY